MGRMLSSSDFGLLISLTSLLSLVALFGGTFTSVFTKLTAKYANHSSDGISHIVQVGGKYIGYFVIGFIVLYLISIPFLMSYLHVPKYEYIILILVAIVGTLFLSIPGGVFQGKMKFFSLSFLTIIQPVIKIVFAFILVSIGLAATGAFTSVALSMFLPAVILCFFILRRNKAIKKKEKEAEIKRDFFHFGYSYFLAGVGLALLMNTDTILARHYFSNTASGQYAALAIMGKAIFYLTSPINMAFFPLVAHKKEKKESLRSTVILASILILGSSFLLSLIYFLFPSIILKVFFPSPSYSQLGSYLGIFSVYIIIFSFAVLLNNYFLSSGKTKVYIITLISGILQIVGIMLFHQSILHIILVLLGNSTLLLILLLLYYVKTKKD